jgi:hypothetical protein
VKSRLHSEASREKQNFVVLQPLYSPGHSPEDFFFFPKLKVWLNGHQFESVQEITREKS